MAVTLQVEGGIALVIIDNPPVNALGREVRERLLALALEVDDDPSVRAVVLTGAGRLFVGGADLSEFDRPIEAPTLPDVIARIEDSTKPWIAAVHGAALGGGLELTLGCRYRVASPGASFALPEVSLGIIPGAGGTQRLPRLIGIEAAVPVVAEKTTLTTAQAHELGLVDRILDGDLKAAALDFAREVADAAPPALARDRALSAPPPAFWAAAEQRIARAAKGSPTPLRALAALRAGVDLGFVAALLKERTTFIELRGSETAAALRHLFFAERAAHRPAHIRGVTPRTVTRVGIVGGGTMGVGIAAALRNAGLPVVQIERDEESLGRARSSLSRIYEAAVARGSLSAEEAASRCAGVTGALDHAALADCDLVIEAVFEDLAVKRAVFARLGLSCAPDAILATNTSYLDPRLIAEGLPGPDRFVGLHFFSPAQVMKLIEIIPTPATAMEVEATCFALAARLGKVPVRSGICEGFIGNRILRSYRGEAEALLRSGVPIAAVDAAMRAFGFAMGPFETQDLSGLDISYLHRQAARARGEYIPDRPADILVRAGRLGQKSGGGWYDYSPGDKRPQPSPETARLLAPLLAPRREMSDPEIVDQLLRALTAVGKAILDEGIARQPADIDLVEVHGYGFPRHKGGPMFLASRNARELPANGNTRL